MANKKTMKEYFGEIKEVLENAGREDLVEFVNGRIELIDKKANSRSTSVNKNQAENEEIKKIIIEELAKLGTATISELLNASDIVNTRVGGSNQKTSALMKQLKDSGLVVRTENKRKAYFTVAENV